MRTMFRCVLPVVLMLGGWAWSAEPVGFEVVKLADHPEVAGCQVGPDGHLYVVSMQRRDKKEVSCLNRYRLDPRGEFTGKRDVVYTWTDPDDLVMGLAIAPDSTPDEVRCYVTINRSYRDLVREEIKDPWGGRVTCVTVIEGRTPEVKDVIVNLAIGFHALNDLAFGADGRLFIGAGSTTTSGAPGTHAAEVPEQLLSAAVLAADLNGVISPIDVKTADGGSYDPYRTDAPVRVYASAIRQPWDNVWHPNGNLYTCTNQNDVAGRTAPGPGVPELRNIKPREFLAVLREGHTYGFPNPSRGEFVLLGGNPSRADDGLWEIKQYPAGVVAPETFDPGLLHRIDDIGGGSANGMMVYRNDGPHQGDIMVCFYGGNGQGRIWAFTPGADGRIARQEPLRDVRGNEVRIPDCLDLCEHPERGHIYVSQYGSQGGLGRNGAIWMLRRAVPPEGERLAFHAPWSDPEPLQTRLRVSAGEPVDQVMDTFPCRIDLVGRVVAPESDRSLRTNWSVHANSSGGAVRFEDPSQLEGAVLVEKPGRYVLKLTAENDTGVSDALLRLVLDENGNRAPEVTLLKMSGRVELGAPMEIAGEVRDDGAPVDVPLVRWEVVGQGSETARLADPASAKSEVTFDRLGVHVLRLQGDDTVRTDRAEHRVEVVLPPGDGGAVAAVATFQAVCAVCHGSDGRAGTENGRLLQVRNLTHPEWQDARRDEEIANVVRDGSREMPPFGAIFDPQGLADITAYVRGLRVDRADLPRVLFVVGQTELKAGDAVVFRELQDLGFAVTVVEDRKARPAMARGMGAVLISATVGSSRIDPGFRGVDVPLVVWEAWLFDDLGMTGREEGVAFGKMEGQRRIEIRSVAGFGTLEGEVTASPPDGYYWGAPGPEATVLATLAGQPERAAVFLYPGGVAMPGGASPGKRVGWFLNDGTAARWSPAVRSLFRATVHWALAD